MQNEKLSATSNAVEITEPAALPDSTEIADHDSVAGSDRLVENESDVSFGDFTAKEADGYTGSEALQPVPISPEMGAEDWNRNDANRSAVTIMVEKSESSGLLNDSGNGEDYELMSDDSATVVDRTLDSKSTELGCIGLQATSAKYNSIHDMETYNDVSNASGITPHHIDLSKVRAILLLLMTVMVNCCKLLTGIMMNCFKIVTIIVSS